MRLRSANTCMKPLFLLALFLLAPCRAQQPVELAWATQGCLSGYAGCAEIEFCEGSGTFGYRLLSESGCGLSTAPVIRMEAGKKYMLTLRNKASEPTNLHTHGLHISGDGNSDDITRHVEPGGCLSYTYDVASNHLGGTFWYHAHHHGSTERHVKGGALGMLIVEDKAIDLPNDARVVEFATGRDSELLLIGIKLSRRMTYGNGAQPAVLSIIQNKWYRLRLVSVEPTGALMNVELPGCDALTTAFDGVWRSWVPGPPTTTFKLTGASRMDMAIRCSSSGSVTFGGTTIAHLNVVGNDGSADLSSPYIGGTDGGSSWESRPSLPNGHYLESLNAGNSALPDNYYSIQMTGGNINGVKWDPTESLAVMGYDSVQEWTIGGSGAHPFHLHVYHMQVVQPGGCEHHEEGQWYDVISSSVSCLVRFRMADYGGRVVLHCHFLKHEDSGAMTWIDVVGGPDPDALNIHYCPGDSCSPDGSCSPLVADQCDLAGEDNCGTPCELSSAPTTCGTGETCTDGVCIGCTSETQSCVSDTDCCSGNCSNGPPASRICLAA